jgi:ABC-2 type transport system permease protein
VTRLLHSEIRRLTSRRLLKWLLLVSVVLVIVLVAIITLQSDPHSLNDNDVMTLRQLWLTTSAAKSLGVNGDNAIATISVLAYLLVIVLGASAVGAEYRAGTVGTVLTWEPRRVRVLTARLIAAALVGMVFFLVVHAVFVGAWVIGVALNGRSGGSGSAFWGDLIALVVRATVLAGVLAAISAAIATLGKNTAAAMGVWFGYLIAIEAILRAQLPDLVPWFLTPNAAAFYGWESIAQNGHTVSAGAGTLRLAAYLAVLGGAAIVVFRRRDVT